jgi:hypothetical protein
LIGGKGNGITIEKHGQSNLAHNPSPTTNTPTKAVLKAPVPDCTGRLAAEVRRLAQRKPLALVVRDKGETDLMFWRPHGSTLPSNVASGPAEPPDLAKACRMVSIGQPCWSAKEATIAASWALASAALPTLAPFMKISAMRPSSNRPTPPVYVWPPDSNRNSQCGLGLGINELSSTTMH